VKADKHWKAHIQLLKEVQNLQPELPTFQAELRDYQKGLAGPSGPLVWEPAWQIKWDWENRAGGCHPQACPWGPTLIAPTSVVQ